MKKIIKSIIFVVIILLSCSFFYFLRNYINFKNLNTDTSQIFKKNINDSENQYIETLEIINSNFFHTWVEFSNKNLIQDKSKIEMHIKNQEDLEEYLKLTGNDFSGDMVWFENNENIVFPTGIYIFTDVTDFYLIEASGNIDFNNSVFAIGTTGGVWVTMIGNQNGRTFENLDIYGSVNLEIGNTGNGWYRSSSNITHIGANSAKQSQGFYLQAFKASNMNFRNLYFNNSQNENFHVFDIMDCDNIIFENITNRGYLENWNQEQLKTINESNSHTIYAELIQIDISLGSSLGTTNFLSAEFKEKYWTPNYSEDRGATKNTTIKNIRSTGYSGITGQDIIDETNNKTYKPYSSTIGAHYVSNDAYTNILLENNYFENVIYVEKNNLERKYAPIHFSILSQNISPTGSQEERVTKIENDAVYQATDTNINDSLFVNCYTGYEKVTPNDVDESECIGKKCKYSKWLADYSQEEHNITKINLVDDNNNIIKTYNEYYPEEPFIDGYVFVSSSYDNKNGVLTRKYRKNMQKVVNNIYTYDTNGKLIENLDDYVLSSSEVISQSTQTLPNGDSILVKNINNIYTKTLKYNINFNFNGLKENEFNVEATYGSSLPKLEFNNPVRNEYKFLGWYDNSDYTKGIMYYDSKGISVKEKYDRLENITLYAGWEYEGSYNIEYNILDDKYLMDIWQKTSVSEYENKIKSIGLYSIEILDKNENKLADKDLIGTGSILKIYKNSKLEKSYTNVVLGDTTGDGVVNIADVSKLYRYLRKKISMDEIYIKAGNVVYTDDKISINDVSKLYRYLRGKITSLK